MPIQWYRQPDGTWILWNTEEAQTAPIQAPPATGASISGKTDTTDIARSMMMEEHDQPGDELSPQGFKLKTTRSDRQYMRQVVRDLTAGKLSEDDKTNRAIGLLGNKLFSITDSGDVYSAFKHIPGGKDANEAILDMFRSFRDKADSTLGAAGLDTNKMTTEEIINYMADQQGWSRSVMSDEPTRGTTEMRQSIEEQMAKAKQLGFEE